MTTKKIVVVLVIACVATAFALTKKDELSQKVLEDARGLKNAVEAVMNEESTDLVAVIEGREIDEADSAGGSVCEGTWLDAKRKRDFRFCQMGAAKRAKNGNSCESILTYYYTNCDTEFCEMV